MSIWSRIVNVFRGDRVNSEFEEEMQSHIDEAVAQGRSEQEARQAFGSTLRLREQSRDFRVSAWLDSLRSDVQFGWRQLCKHKAVSAAAVLSLALSMGACVGAFRLVDAMLLRPLPVSDPSRLFSISYPFKSGNGQIDTGEIFDYPQFRAIRSAVAEEADLISISPVSRNGLRFGTDDEAEKFMKQFVSGTMFGVLGLKPAAGRLLTQGDDVKAGAHPVAVLSYTYWTKRFGRDPNVVGRKFHFGSDVFEIVGICEKGFTGTDPGTFTDIFMPSMMNTKAIENYNWGWFRTWVRVKPGSDPERVKQKLQAAVSAWRRELVKKWPTDRTPAGVDDYVRGMIHLNPAGSGVSSIKQSSSGSLTMLCVVVGLVLLIACVNAANLMLAQASSRAREMALRVSIGAGRARLMQLVLIEGLLLASISAALGAVFAWWSSPWVVAQLNGPEGPTELALPFDWRILSFGIVLIALVTLLLALVPALRASATKPMAALRGGEDPRVRHRLIHALVAAQVAVCFLVQFLGGLFVTTYDRLANQPTGFSSTGVLAIEVATKLNQPSVRWNLVLQRLQAVPGVDHVAMASWALMSGSASMDTIRMPGRPQETEETYFLGVSPGWFETMGVSLISGRDLSPKDSYPGSVVVNQAFARRYFNGGDPIGGSFEAVASENRFSTSRIVGIAGDARYVTMRESIRPTVYWPLDFGKKGTDWMTFLVNAKPGADLAAVIRQEVAKASPEFRVVNFQRQSDLVAQQTILERLLAMLSWFFAALALLLACIGLYGVLHHSVVQRRKEIGIRMALGARAANVTYVVAMKVLISVVMGSLIGLAVGAASEGHLKDLLYGVKATDAAMMAGPVCLIVFAGLLAAVPPVLQALRIDPSETLRAD
jgi:putative ABC transport system permease protein